MWASAWRRVMASQQLLLMSAITPVVLFAVVTTGSAARSHRAYVAEERPRTEPVPGLDRLEELICSFAAAGLRVTRPASTPFATRV